MVFPIFLRRSRSDERSVIRRSGGKPSERGTSRVSYSSPLAYLLLTSCLPLAYPSSPLAHPLFTSCLPLLTSCSPPDHPFLTPCSPLVYLLLTSCLPLAYLLPTSVIPASSPLSFPQVLSGNPEKGGASFPFSFCRKVPPLCLPGCRTQTGKRRTSEEGMRLEERERTNADRLEHHRHPRGSPFSGFPLKTCGNDRRGDYGNDRRGDCGNVCPAARPRCLLRLSFPTLVIGNPLL